MAADPEGWARHGHPEWGQFKFGHAHPAHSTTGFSMMANLAYATLGERAGLSPEKVKSPEVIEAFRAVETIGQEQEKDEIAGEKRLYGIVVLSDGDDTYSYKTEADMFNCLPSGEDVAGVKVFTIAYGDDADEDLLLRIANHTNGKFFRGDPETIDRIYLAISSEQ